MNELSLREALEAAEAGSLACRVCRHGGLDPFMTLNTRAYLHCSRCQCIVVGEADLPDRSVEEAQYRLHENDVSDAGYRAFVNKVIEPLSSVLEPGARGLDYGCGPGPVGAVTLREKGFEIHEYDPIFAPDLRLLEQRYDFVLCSEVAEHFHHPAREFDHLETLLRPGGWLAIMTSFLTDLRHFARWHYHRDPTHVAFYSERTFGCIASDGGWDLIVPRPNVALLRVPGGDGR